MDTYTGRTLSGGVAIGKMHILSNERREAIRRPITDAEAEIVRYASAVESAKTQLAALYAKAEQTVGKESAEIFDVHIMMLEDDDYRETVQGIICEELVNAEFAVAQTRDQFAAMFQSMDDEYFRARSADICDISERLIACLRGDVPVTGVDEPAIIAARDLAPSETVQMDRDKLLGFVIELGSNTSHTAILARTMCIPAITGIAPQRVWNGKLAVIDGGAGMLYIDPDENTLRAMREKQAQAQAEADALRLLKDADDVTAGGKRVTVAANIGSVADLAAALDVGANGIGLFRSEFLYLGEDDYPSEDAQFAAYKAVAEGMRGKTVVIRTLDIGADKKVDYFDLAPEENPALGYRAIRICLDRPEVFKTQLRAIYRASAFGRIAIMYPMIISADEVRRVKEIAAEVRQSLAAEGITVGEVEQGIMIETPAAAVMSDELAKEVDFFSIGTNDLTQYTLAIDRQNRKLDMLYDPHHPAVLRLIRAVCENGHREGCWVGICGELAADLSLTDTFVDMGIDELSVSPGSVLPLRKAIREKA